MKNKLKSKGSGNRPNKADTITPEIIEKMRNSGEIGVETGRTLQNSPFFFHHRVQPQGSHVSRQSQWGYVKLKVNSEGNEYFEFKERLTKTRQGNREARSRASAR